MDAPFSSPVFGGKTNRATRRISFFDVKESIFASDGLSMKGD